MRELWLVSAAFLAISFLAFLYSSLKGVLWAKVVQSWAQCLGFSLLVATCLHFYSSIEKSIGTLTALVALFYFFTETVLHALWLKIASKDSLLFPRYTSLKSLPVPREKRLIELTEKVENQHFRPAEGYACQLGGLSIQGSFYLHENQHTILQLIFAPILLRGKLKALFSCTTALEDGKLVITDNYHGPAALHTGGIYHLTRRPLIGSFQGLLKRHAHTLRQFKSPPTPFAPTTNWVNWHNEQLTQLKQINLEKGLLSLSCQAPYTLDISGEGHFQIWKSSIKMRYFGLA